MRDSPQAGTDSVTIKTGRYAGKMFHIVTIII